MRNFLQKSDNAFAAAFISAPLVIYAGLVTYVVVCELLELLLP
jgi:hypothetical protein